jgi:hypothetical protein
LISRASGTASVNENGLRCVTIAPTITEPPIIST